MTDAASTGLLLVVAAVLLRAGGARAQATATAPPPPDAPQPPAPAEPPPPAFISDSLSFWAALNHPNATELRLTHSVLLSADDLRAATSAGGGPPLRLRQGVDVLVTSAQGSNSSATTPTLDFDGIKAAIMLPVRARLTFSFLRVAGLHETLYERPAIFTNDSAGVLTFSSAITQRAACLPPGKQVLKMIGVATYPRTSPWSPAPPPAGRRSALADTEAPPTAGPELNSGSSTTADANFTTSKDDVVGDDEPDYFDYGDQLQCPQPSSTNEGGQQVPPCDKQALAINDFSYTVGEEGCEQRVMCDACCICTYGEGLGGMCAAHALLVLIG